jgi:DNA-binding NarL/FixJ family response regulator
MIRVLLVDDHAAFRQALAFMLEREPDITVVGQAQSLAEAREMLKDVDVAVLDLGLPDGNGADLISELRSASPHSMVLVLTASTNRKEIAQAIEAGAAGVIHKSAHIDEIMGAVRRLSMGEHLLSTREVVEMLRLAREARELDREAQLVLSRLTPREQEVLQALACGLNDKEIAQRLQISTQTARTHMVNILNKLGVDSRLEALLFAIRHGVVKID